MKNNKKKINVSIGAYTIVEIGEIGEKVLQLLHAYNL